MQVGRNPEGFPPHERGIGASALPVKIHQFQKWRGVEIGPQYSAETLRSSALQIFLAPISAHACPVSFPGATSPLPLPPPHAHLPADHAA